MPDHSAMGFRLRAGLSFCVASDRLVFLDVDRDRYFCLSSATEAAFRRLVESKPISGDDRQRIARLASDGFLIEVEGPGLLQPCTPPKAAESSLLEVVHDAVPARETIAALIHLARAEACLRFRSLGHTIAWLERAKRSSQPPPADADRSLRTVAAAFQRTSLIATPLNKCLPRAVAVASRCFARGLAPTVVIAVKLQPFAAHCWVQQAGFLVNERIDSVREFVPIRVI